MKAQEKSKKRARMEGGRWRMGVFLRCCSASEYVF
jgi:hypothetical protein